MQVFANSATCTVISLGNPLGLLLCRLGMVAGGVESLPVWVYFRMILAAGTRIAVMQTWTSCWLPSLPVFRIA